MWTIEGQLLFEGFKRGVLSFTKHLSLSDSVWVQKPCSTLWFATDFCDKTSVPDGE